MVFYSRVPLRRLIPTVLVRLATDDGEIAFRARWKHSPLELQRSILFRLRQGSLLWFEDERGHALCFRPERVWGAMVDGRPRRLDLELSDDADSLTPSFADVDWILPKHP